jgi:hypothetical protein
MQNQESKEEFKLPQSSYGELVKIIQAYGASDQATSLTEMNQRQ